MIGVAGIPGNIKGKPVKGGNPYEGYRSEGYPLPPLRSAGLSDHFRQACEALGYHPYPVPAGINSIPHDDRPACTYCGFNAFFGCHIDAKSTVDLTFVKKAVATGNLEIRTQSRVLRVTTERQGACRRRRLHRCRRHAQPRKGADCGARRVHVRECAPAAAVAD